MKNFTLSITLLATISCMSAVHARHTQFDDASKKSIFAYLYNHVIPHATDTSLPQATHSSKKVIIFDLDDVLCTTNTIRQAQEIGIKQTAKYIVDHFSSPNNEQLLFDSLKTAPAVSHSKIYSHNAALPQIMVDWKIGAQDLRDIQDTMMQHISAANMSIADKNFLTATILMMTTPAKYVRSKQIIPDGLALARQLKKLGYKLYILANWDSASLPVLMQQFPELFLFEGKDLFDGIMTSGQQHVAKPDAKIYHDFLHKFSINPSHAIFIDSIMHNIQTATRLGISSICCKNKNIFDVQKELKKIL